MSTIDLRLIYNCPALRIHNSITNYTYKTNFLYITCKITAEKSLSSDGSWRERIIKEKKNRSGDKGEEEFPASQK